MALALKHRPATLEEVAGNELTIKTLKATMSKDRDELQHAFLLTGPSGCGKTTIARIISNMLGCIGDDYCEVDSAQFRGIDTIRDIRTKMMFKPMTSNCRVWLIDECHQLSKDAQNAMLKALEDCPKHVYFILATTDPEKLLATIKGRCATFEVQPLDKIEMADFLKNIARSERKRVPPDVLNQIARDSLGSCRNALQILDKVIDLDPEDMKAAAVQEAEKENQVIELCRALFKMESWKSISRILEGLLKEDPVRVQCAIMAYCESILLSGDADAAPAAALVMSYFREPYFLNGRQCLVHDIYQASTDGKS